MKRELNPVIWTTPYEEEQKLASAKIKEMFEIIQSRHIKCDCIAYRSDGRFILCSHGEDPMAFERTYMYACVTTDAPEDRIHYTWANDILRHPGLQPYEPYKHIDRIFQYSALESVFNLPPARVFGYAFIAYSRK